MTDCHTCRDGYVDTPGTDCEECAALSPERRAVAYAIARCPEYFENRSAGWQSKGFIERLAKMGFELQQKQPARHCLYALDGDVYLLPLSDRAAMVALDFALENGGEMGVLPDGAVLVEDLHDLTFIDPQEF